MGELDILYRLIIASAVTVAGNVYPDTGDVPLSGDPHTLYLPLVIHNFDAETMGPQARQRLIGEAQQRYSLEGERPYGEGVVLVDSSGEWVLADIVEQPDPVNNPGWVSSEPGTFTRFTLPRNYPGGNDGLLAHNSTIMGMAILAMVEANGMNLIDSTSTVRTYVAIEVNEYEALPDGTYRDLKDSTIKTLNQVFFRVYQARSWLGIDDPEGVITFQTCIERNGDSTWGRRMVLFVDEQYMDPQIVLKKEEQADLRLVQPTKPMIPDFKNN